MPSTIGEVYVASSQYHVLDMPAANDLAVKVAVYRTEVAYEQIRLGCSQYKMIEFLKRYNDANGLKGPNMIRSSSPAMEYALSTLGCEHAAFHNQFERKGKQFVATLTDTQLRRPTPNEYKEIISGKPVYRRDIWQHNGELWVQIGEGWRIPEGGVIDNVAKVIGIPVETISHSHGPGSRIHWGFDPDLDNAVVYLTGHQPSGCLHLSAQQEPNHSTTNSGFRPVRGPVPMYKKLKVARLKQNGAPGTKFKK